MSTFTASLRARGEVGLAALLGRRPDLAAPPPASVRALAARACTRVSLDRALNGVDALVLQAVEAVLALHGTHRPPSRRPDAGEESAGVDIAEVAAAVGLPVEELTAAVRRAVDLALLWSDDGDAVDGALHPAPGLHDVLGPYPAGLGPTLATTLGRRSEEGLDRLADALGLTEDALDRGAPEKTGDDGVHSPDGTDVTHDADVTHGTDSTDSARASRIGAVADQLASRSAVEELLTRSPQGARQVLDALTWGPPVGRSPDPSTAGRPSPARRAVDWLLRHGLLAGQDGQHVVLPREAALALRDGRTHRSPATAPRPEGSHVDRGTVDAESGTQAMELTRLVGALLTLWGSEPASVLRSGGLGARELRRVASRLEVDDATAALVVEIAGAAGLVADDGEDPPELMPTTDGEDWRRLPPEHRWAELAGAWMAAERAAWLVGTRDDKGSLRAALDPESRRPWAPRLRIATLEVVAGAERPADPADDPASMDGPASAEGLASAEGPAGPDPVSLTAAQVHEILTWRSPRSAPPEHAVQAVLSEAARLGVLGAGAVSSAGLTLLDTPPADDRPRVAPLSPVAEHGAQPGPAEALAAQLPPQVEEVLLQGDLTGIVPGRPSADLASLLETSSEVESRGAGLTVRFTPASVRRALDAGRTGEQLLADLSRHARSGVPQPLEYLVLDAARRHGQVRVGMASSYLRSDDPALLAGLVEDRSLHHLGLLRLAPTVITAQATPAAFVTALRARGLAPVTEDPSGHVLVTGPQRHVVRRPRGRRPSPPTVPRVPGAADGARERRLLRVAADLLSTHRAEPGHQDGLHGGPQDDGGNDGEAGRTGTAEQVTSSELGTPDPVLALAMLREAAEQGHEVWLEIVGPTGASQRRRVRPVRVDAGRVRAIDADRETELTVVAHRIVTVTPVQTRPTPRQEIDARP